MHARPTELERTLQGRRVVEVAGGLAGQHCGYALAGLGASVTVLRPDGTPDRPLDEFKQTVDADVRTPEGFEALLRHCEGADVFIEERPPAGWPQAGPLFKRLQERHPELVVVCLTPFGLDGPHADYAAHPLNSYHACGMAQQIPCDPLRPQDRQRAPLQAGGHWGEAQAGTMGALTCVAHLLDAKRHAGVVIDCSAQETLISFFWTEVARFPNEHRSPTRLSPMATIVGGVLPARDGFVQIAVREDHQWAALAQLLEHPEWIVDARYATRAARTSRPADIGRLLAAQTQRFAKMDLQARGREAGIPIAAVLAPGELLADAELASRGTWRGGATAQVKWPLWDASVSLPAVAPASASASVERPRVVRPTQQTGPLAGLRALDLGWVAMGPYAGYALAGLGAEVIHVGKPAAAVGPGVDLATYNYGFDTLNTGKTWIGLDLKAARGRELLLELVAQSDVLLENFRPGVMRRLGLDYDTLCAVNPRLVMLSASTYGERGVAGSYPGYAPVFSALGGLAHFTGYADGPPARNHPVDFYAGLVGVTGIVAGLHRLAATGHGCHIDLSAREAVLWSLSHAMAQVQAQGGDGRWANGHASMAPHGAYRCAGENRWLSIAIGSDAQWKLLCDCMGDAQLSQDANLAYVAGRLAHRQRIDERIEQWTRLHDDAELTQLLQSRSVAAFPSVTGEDLWNDSHLHARGVFASRPVGEAKRWYVAPAWIVQGAQRTPLDTITGSAALRRVLGDVLGKTQAQIDAFQSDGVVTPRY